jgi:hypothetical protein
MMNFLLLVLLFRIHCNTSFLRKFMYIRILYVLVSYMAMCAQYLLNKCLKQSSQWKWDVRKDIPVDISANIATYPKTWTMFRLTSVDRIASSTHMSFTKIEVHVSPMNVARHNRAPREDVFGLPVCLLRRTLRAPVDVVGDIAHIV